MPSARKFYHTVLQTEVLSEEPFQWENLEDVEHHITDGGCSGRTIATIDNKEKTGPEIAKLLLSQGTDPEFFGLTDAGEEVDISQVLARIEESGGPEPDDLICDQCQCKFPVPNNDDFSGGYYDCWDVDGHPSHHYDCCSAECEQKFMEGFEYCDKVNGTYIHCRKTPSTRRVAVPSLKSPDRTTWSAGAARSR